MRLFGEKSQPDERDQFQVRKPRTVTLPGPVEQIPRQLSAHVCLSENTDGTFCRRTWAQEPGSRWGPQMPIPTRDLCCHLSETCSSFPSYHLWCQRLCAKILENNSHLCMVPIFPA